MGKKIILFFTLIGIWQISLLAQSTISKGRMILESKHFLLESDLDDAQTRFIAVQLEAAFNLFQEYFKNSVPSELLRVRIFSSHEAYIRALSALPDELNLGNRQDFLFLLNKSRSEMSTLLIYPRDSLELMQKSLLKNSFLHYIFSISPEMSTWLREGLALFFELAIFQDNDDIFLLNENHFYLDRLQIIRETNPILLKELINFNDDIFEQNLETSLAHSWATVNYLMLYHESVLKEIISNELAGNHNHSKLNSLVDEIEQYFNRPGFNVLVSYGRETLSQKEYEKSLDYFLQAQLIDSRSWLATYYLGLTHFYLNHYEEALKYYEKALSLEGVQMSLIYYALGILAMAQDNFSLAESYFVLAETEDRQRFGRYILDQRRIMESKKVLQ